MPNTGTITGLTAATEYVLGTIVGWGPPNVPALWEAI